jgi:hypothetical protein
MSIELLLCLMALLLLANCGCYGDCNTCIDPTSPLYSYYCTSCNSGFYLTGNSCYPCNTCMSAATCQQCPGYEGLYSQAHTNEINMTYVWVGISLGGVALFFIIFCCLRCIDKARHPPVAQDGNVSETRLKDINVEEIEWQSAAVILVC